MFLIAGISPKTKTLESTPRVCSDCGLAQAYLKRVDYYFNLFFIPLLRVKKGQPLLICNRCYNPGFEYTKQNRMRKDKQGLMCKQCGRSLQKDFRYCPFCGNRL